MALIDPFEVHVTQSLDPGQNSYIVIKFVPEILYTAEQPIYEMKCLLPYLRMGAAHQKIFSVRELEANRMNRTVMEIYEEYRSKSFGYELAIRTAISRLFLCILRQWHAQNSSIGTDMEGPTLVLLQKAFDFIEANYHQEIGLKEAAEQCCMSYTAFSRLFSKYTRKGFAEYLLAVRLKKATVLLVATQKPITEIALETGFTTTSYFIQRFRMAYGTTPLRYRKQFALAEAHSLPSTPSIVKVRE
jgi:AraC-like DNA-binding protein